MSKPIRIVIVDDHSILRESLRALLEKQDDFQVVADAADGRAAIKAVREHAPDVVIMDIGMPSLNGIDATREIVSVKNPPRVLCLSIHREPGLVSAMLKAGASGYVLKNSSAHELPAAVRAVAKGETYLCPKVSGDLVNQHIDGKKIACGEAFADLTPREREVLQLLAEGHHTKSVAAQLDINHDDDITNLLRSITDSKSEIYLDGCLTASSTKLVGGTKTSVAKDMSAALPNVTVRGNAGFVIGLRYFTIGDSESYKNGVHQ